MSAVLSVSTRLLVFLVLLTLIFAPCSFSATTWNGVLRDAVGKPVADAKITLRGDAGNRTYEVRTSASGTFDFAGVEAGTYSMAVEWAGEASAGAEAIVSTEGNGPKLRLESFGEDEA